MRVRLELLTTGVRVVLSCRLDTTDQRFDAFHSGEPLHYRTMEDILDELEELHLAQEVGKPYSFADAEGESVWRAALQNKTWELTELRWPTQSP